MRFFVLLFSLLISRIGLFTQVPVTQIEGYLEVYHPDDTTSIYVGKGIGVYNLSSSESFNSFFGTSAGRSNILGSGNSFFGMGSGEHLMNGESNSFFGMGSGQLISNGSANSFFGAGAGFQNKIGGFNAFVGINSGSSNVNGSNNTIIGSNADLDGPNKDSLNFATAIGAESIVSSDNTLVLGRPTDATVIPGRLVVGQDVPTIPHSIGTAVHINAGEGGDSELIIESDTNNAGSEAHNPRISFKQDGQTVTGFIALEGHEGTTSIGTFANSLLFGSEKNNVPLHFITDSTSRMTIKTNGRVVINELGAETGSLVPLCRNGLLEISTCPSSAKFKSSSKRMINNIKDYHSGLEMLRLLHPVSYSRIKENTPDLGFIAEEIAKIDERLITRNDQGEVEGVKYDRLTTILVNAVKEQQKMIEDQKKMIEQLIKQDQKQDVLIKRIVSLKNIGDN